MSRAIELVLLGLLGAVLGLLAGAITVVWLMLGVMSLHGLVPLAPELYRRLALINVVLGGLNSILVMFVVWGSMLLGLDPIAVLTRSLNAAAAQLRTARRRIRQAILSLQGSALKPRCCEPAAAWAGNEDDRRDTGIGKGDGIADDAVAFW